MYLVPDNGLREIQSSRFEHRWVIGRAHNPHGVSHRLRSGNELRVITALFATVRTEFGPRNSDPPKAKTCYPRLREQADVSRVGFFRGNARNRNGLRVGVSRLAMSLCVARDILGWSQGVGLGRPNARSLDCLCRAYQFGLLGVPAR